MHFISSILSYTSRVQSGYKNGYIYMVSICTRLIEEEVMSCFVPILSELSALLAG